MSATSGVNVRSGLPASPVPFLAHTRLHYPTSSPISAHWIACASRLKRRLVDTLLTGLVPFTQVLRYSALAFGVFYGFTHQRSIYATQRAAAEKHEYEHKQQLIEKAKAEFAKKKSPASASSTTGGREYNKPAASAEDSSWQIGQWLTEAPVNQDPMSPNFDLEAYFSALVKENP